MKPLFDIKQFWTTTGNTKIVKNPEPKFYLTYTTPNTNIINIFHDGKKILSVEEPTVPRLEQMAEILASSSHVDSTKIIKIK
jgi:hypothetical protein